MKQKSLMSFFGKTPTKDGDAKTAAPPKAKAAATPKVEKVAATPKVAKTASKEKAEKTSEADASSPVVTEARTPLPKGSSQSSGIVSATYTRSSEGSARDTPPTSDPIDVDMISDEDELGAVQSSAARPVCHVLHARCGRLTSPCIDGFPDEAEDSCRR